MRAKNEVWICGQITGEWKERGTPWEFQGVFSKEQLAVAACRNKSYFVFPATMDEQLPDEPMQCAQAYWPRG